MTTPSPNNKGNIHDHSYTIPTKGRGFRSLKQLKELKEVYHLVEAIYDSGKACLLYEVLEPLAGN